MADGAAGAARFDGGPGPASRRHPSSGRRPIADHQPARAPGRQPRRHQSLGGAAWTGVFQTRLEERHNWAVAAAITAVPFAAIHLPLQFFLDQPVTPSSLAAAFAVYLLLGVLVRPLLAVFRRGTGDSLLLVALLHSVFNRTNNQNGLAATLLDGDARQLTMLVAVVVLTGILRSSYGLG